MASKEKYLRKYIKKDGKTSKQFRAGYIGGMKVITANPVSENRDSIELGIEPKDSVELEQSHVQIVEDSTTAGSLESNPLEEDEDGDLVLPVDPLTSTEDSNNEWGKSKSKDADQSKQLAKLGKKLDGQTQLARYSDDPTLNEYQRGEERWEDPMLGFIKEKRHGKKRKHRSGKKFSEVKFDEAQGGANRFNIPPGNHWDGINRGNGFEERYFKAQASRIEREREAAKENTVDL